MTASNDTLDQARGDLGIAEDPAGSNHTPITEWYADTSGLEWTRRGNPWCDMSVSKWLTTAGVPTLYCYCPTHVNAFKTGEAGTWIGDGDPQSGDVVFFDWDHDGIADHVGLVEVVNSDGTVTTIEGNVGDAVRRQIRHRSVILGFGRPNYTTTSEDDMKDADRALVQQAIDAANNAASVASDIRNLIEDPNVGVLHRLDSVEQKVDHPIDEVRRNLRRVGSAVNAQGIEGS